MTVSFGKCPCIFQYISLHTLKVTVWCGFTASFIIGPIFFEEGMPNGFLICTLTVRRYKNTLEGFVVPLILQRQCLHSIYFMQVSAPPHIELHVFVWYHTLMVEHLIVCFRKSDNLIFETLIPFVLRCVFA